jgi:hypothetical protein
MKWLSECSSAKVVCKIIGHSNVRELYRRVLVVLEVQRVGNWINMIVVMHVICLQALYVSASSVIVQSEAFNTLTVNCQNLSFKVKLKQRDVRHFNYNFTLL